MLSLPVVRPLAIALAATVTTLTLTTIASPGAVPRHRTAARLASAGSGLGPSALRFGRSLRSPTEGASPRWNAPRGGAVPPCRAGVRDRRCALGPRAARHDDRPGRQAIAPAVSRGDHFRWPPVSRGWRRNRAAPFARERARRGHRLLRAERPQSSSSSLRTSYNSEATGRRPPGPAPSSTMREELGLGGCHGDGPRGARDSPLRCLAPARSPACVR